MNWKVIVLALCLVEFLGLTSYAIYTVGYLGFFAAAAANAATLTLSYDVVLALSLISIWMWKDARERGASFAPYLVITLLLGSAGPLLYLIRREWTPRTETNSAPGASYGTRPETA